jgi:hypothetical protein
MDHEDPGKEPSGDRGLNREGAKVARITRSSVDSLPGTGKKLFHPEASSPLHTWSITGVPAIDPQDPHQVVGALEGLRPFPLDHFHQPGNTSGVLLIAPIDTDQITFRRAAHRLSPRLRSSFP